MTITPAPATDWREVVQPDEAERHAAFSEEIVALQQKINRKRGPGRAFHRKQVAGLTGVLTVSEAEPELRQGLFAETRTLPVRIRMSNGSISTQADIVPDIRGFAFSVRDVSAPGALFDTTDRQDFLLINRPVFGMDDSREFAEVFGPSARGQVALVKHFVATRGPIRGPLEAARLTRDFLRPFTGFATATFHSAAPIRFGPYAVMVRLVPVGAPLNLTAARDWSADIAGRLAVRDLSYDLQVQFFLSDDVTPIENLRHPWPEKRSPFHTVARLRIPRQDLASPEGLELAASIEADHFDPWAAFADHQPLGEVMRARKVAYFPSVQARRG